MLVEKFNQFTISQKKNNKNIKKKSGKKLFPLNPSMNVNRLNRILKK